MSTPTFPILLNRLAQYSRRWPIHDSVNSERKRIESLLQAQGGIVLGRGAFATVYGLGSHAIKVVLTSESRAYLDFVRYSQRARHASLPRIHRTLRIRRHTVVVMERLRENGREGQKMAAAFNLMVHGNNAFAVGRLVRRRSDHLASIFGKISTIRARHTRSEWDIKSENILFRRERGNLRAVLTDPLSY